MKKFLLFFFTFLCTLTLTAQDFSNKGKDFWVGYGYHQVMTAGNVQQMVLYFATDQVTTVTVTIPGIGYSQTYSNIPANTVFTSNPLPKAFPQDARLITESVTPENKGIHIVADKAIVAYAHIYNMSVSGASILFPTNTLGKEYYSINYTNISNTNDANCWMYVIATDTGTTTVEITPIVATLNHVAGVPFTVNLTQGQVYNLMATFNNGSNPKKGGDLTGSKIKSISSGSGGCKRIAVFSGSGRISITCNGTASSSDNYMVQAFPKSAWGKKYLTSHTGGLVNNIYRVCVSDPAAVVKVNGVTLNPFTLQSNFYYDIAATQAQLKIESDLPIIVAQYMPSQGACGTTGNGDPEIIYLSPVEQNISKVIWNATPNFAILSHFYNVVIPNTGTALSSFLLDGNPVNPVSFTVHPQDPGFSYLIQSVSAGQHTIQSDSGFNAIAYGLGNAESYGYNAGTNVIDLYQRIFAGSQYGIEPTPTVCSGSPFRFKVRLPYLVDSIKWDLSNLPGPPVPSIRVFSSPPDSTTIINGKTLYWYSIPTFYSFTQIGIYPVTITTYSPDLEGCGTEQNINFDLTVTGLPTADYIHTNPVCIAETVQFNDNSITPRPNYIWWWDFDDPGSGANNNSTINNPTHIFTTAGIHNVRFSSITTSGCLSDTISKPITIAPLPNGTITGTTTVCLNTATQVVFTGTVGAPEFIFSYTIDAGSGPGPTLTATSTGGVATLSLTNAVAGTFIYKLTSIKNVGSTLCTQNITGQTATVTVNNNSTLTLTSAPSTTSQVLCQSLPIIPITYVVGSGGTGATVSGLPTGVTGTYSGGIFTISGTPTVIGIFNYTVTTTGPCLQGSSNGTITINPDAGISLTSAASTTSQSLCINTPIINITYAITGGGTGATITGLPAGVTAVFAGGIYTISGSPSVTGTFNYTVNTTGTCVQKTASGTIIVNPDASLTLTSSPATANQSICVNTSIINITYAVSGGGTNASVTGLPTGVTGVYAGGNVTISGAPTVTGVFNYTVTTTGTCAQKILNGSITVNPDASITLTSAPSTTSQSVCINTAIVNITYSITGGGTGATISGLPAGVTAAYTGGTYTISGSPAITGTFNYTINTTGTCVQKTASGTIIVNPDATLTLTSSASTANQSLCINVPIINITYTVSGGGTNASVTGLPPGVNGLYSAGTFTISGTPTVTGAFIYTVTTSGTCTQKTLSGSITVTPDATLTLTSLPATTAQELCRNSTLTNITYAIGGGGTGATVTGLPTGVTAAYAGGTFTISGTPTVSGVFNFIVNTSGTCIQKTASGSIIVNALPTAIFSASTPACNTGDVSFTDLSTPNAGNLNEWTWSFGDPGSGAANASALRNPVHNFANAGTYTVTLLVKTDKGCTSATSSQQIIINSRPKAGFIDPQVCLSDTYASFIDTSRVAGGTIVGWLWNFDDPGSGALNTSTLQNPNHSYSTVGTKNVKLIATSNFGCKDTTIQSFVVNGDIPVAGFTVTNSSGLCANDSVRITNTSTVNVGSVIRIEIYWDNAGAPATFDTYLNPLAGDVFTHKYPTSINTRTYTIRYRVYSGITCINDKFQTVTVNAAPSVLFNAIPNTCLNVAPFQVTQASETGGVPGSFAFSGPGINAAGIFNPLLVGPGTFRLLYTFTSAKGCIDTASQTITVLTAPVADFTKGSPACQGETLSFSDNSSSTIGSLTTWTWNFGDGSLTVIRNNPTTFTHTFIAAGTFTVSLVVTTSDGCKSTPKTMQVIISPQPHPKFTYPVTACLPNASVSFTDASSIADGTESSFTYLWNFDDPTSSSNTSTAKNPTHTYTAIGPYNVRLQVRSGAGCVHDTVIVVNTIHPRPIANFDFNKPSICIADDVTFLDLSNGMDGTLTSWTWKFGDGGGSALQNPAHTYGNIGTFDVKLVVSNSIGCTSDTSTKVFNVYPYPVVNAGPDLVVLEGGSTVITPTVSGNDLLYLWLPNQYLSNNRSNLPVTTPAQDITYTLTVTSRGGCSSSDQVFIKVLKGPEIPNTFTPNNDGINDYWDIRYLETYLNNRVQVFSRTGQLVFESRGYRKRWDGNMNGKPLPVDTYYYIIEPGNGRKPLTGYVTIIK
ncbi:MAG: PKD domain-containing protein [Ferruginibacter sp.]